MSLALEFLSSFFEVPKNTRADFAKAAGIDASLVTNILQGDVQLSSKNIPKLLRGFRTDHERREFLAAYLKDQVPRDFADDIRIHLSHLASGEDANTAEDEAELQARLIRAWLDLPNAKYRRRVVNFLVDLRKDAALRDLFARTMAYREGGSQGGGSLSPFPDKVAAALKRRASEGDPTRAPRK